MKKPILVAILAFTCSCVLVVRVGGDEIIVIYKDKLQVPMFAGFLTLAGFVLSLKTNILLRLHKDLFELPDYEKRVRDAELLNGKPISRYGPLKNLGEFLVWTVFSCLVASVLQLTIGFFYKPWSTAICVGSTAAAFTFTIWAWVAIRANLRVWFDIIEEADRKKARGG